MPPPKILSKDEYPEFQYKPAHQFMRCHSHNDDPADGATKIWRCAFEPDVDDNEKWTGIVATCGGSYICLIDTHKGECKAKLLQHEDQYFDVLWCTVQFADKVNTNVLAAAGAEGRVTLIHPAKNKMFAHLPVFKKAYISCLRLHPANPNWLFCGADHGKIALIDTGLTGAVNYEISWQKVKLFHCTGTDIIQMVCKDNFLISAAQKGCYVWKMKNVHKDREDQPHDCQLVFPGSSSADNYCDGISLLDDSTVAVKFSKSASIFLWSLSVLSKKLTPVINIKPDLILPWVKTSEIYIDITSRDGLLVAGDHKGNILLYSIGEFLKNKSAYGDTETARCTLLWPSLKPDTSDPINKRLKKIDTPPLINHAQLSPDMKYLVACTDNNLVCIWSK